MATPPVLLLCLVKLYPTSKELLILAAFLVMIKVVILQVVM